jgi:hypothetical protein
MTQLALFETPAEPVHKSGKDLRRERSQDPAVAADMLAIFAAKPGEWLDVWAFYGVLMKYDISGFLHSILWRLRDAGRIEEKDVYFGDEQPGGKNYLGFSNEYRFVEEVTA